MLTRARNGDKIVRSSIKQKILVSKPHNMLNLFLNVNSREAANRTIKTWQNGEFQVVPVRYLNYSRLELL